MARHEIDFCLIKDGDNLIGFSCVAGAQTEAEYFCTLFPRALVDGKAQIIIRSNVVTLKHPTEGECSFCLDENDAKQLDNLLKSRGKFKDTTLGLYKDGLFTPGFKITIEGRENIGRKQPKVPPTRVTARTAR